MLETLAHGRHNNFNLIRVISAGAVLASHAYPLALGPAPLLPLAGLAPSNLGRLAVAVFFSISGFFITKSFARRSSLLSFFLDRVLRIMPGLFVVLALSVMVIGPLWTEMPVISYALDRHTWSYVPRGLSLFRLSYTLPGVFEKNPSSAINGSLWSLWLEVTCYGIVVIVGLAYALSRWRFGCFLLIYGSIYCAFRLWGVPNWPLFCEVSLPFVIGMVFYVFRDQVPLHLAILIGLAALTYFLRWSPLYREAFVTMLSYLVFYVAALPWHWLRMYNRLGDYSYGMYIYAFPIEQVTVALRPAITPVELIALALPATLGCAILSWHWVEKPMLERRHEWGRVLVSRFVPAA